MYIYTHTDVYIYTYMCIYIYLIFTYIYIYPIKENSPHMTTGKYGAIAIIVLPTQGRSSIGPQRLAGVAMMGTLWLFVP